MTVKHDPLEPIRDFEQDLIGLLFEHFGEKWSHNWDREDGYFYLRLSVYDKPFTLMWERANEDD